MKIQLFVAVALATGGYGFAANAKDAKADPQSPRTLMEFLQKQGKASGEATQAKSKAGSAVKKAGRSNAKPGATPRMAKAMRTRGKFASRQTEGKKSGRTAKRKRVVIDTRTTGSIASLRAFATNSDKQKAGAWVKNSAAAGSFNPIIARYAAQYGVPAALAHAVIRVESNYRPSALGSAGEVGLMQIKPATARMLGYSGSAKGLYDPDTNIRWGMKYLSQAHSLGGGDTCGTILRYNAGHAATRMNPISAAYCVKVKRHMAGG